MANLLPYLVHLKMRRPEFEPPPEEPPGPGGGQPQILNITNISDTMVEVTVHCPEVPGADRIEWWAGSNTADRWNEGSQTEPIVSFTATEVVFTAPRQPTTDDPSFFCYRGANAAGSAPNHNCNGFTILSQEPTEPEPGELGAPFIEQANAFVNPHRVVLTTLPGQNAEQHDVHRVNGNDQEFVPGPGNIIQQNIGAAPFNVPDDTVAPLSPYTYRLVSKAVGFTPQPSNPAFVHTLGDPQPSDRPNDPGFSEPFVAHDFNFVPPIPSGGSQTLPASHSGFIRSLERGNLTELRRNYLGQLGFEGITGAIPVSAFTSGGIGGDLEVPHVMHGPVAPHGMSWVGRHRLPAGMGNPNTGIAAGNGGSWGFFPTTAAQNGPQYRRLYQHYWLLYEGHKFEGQRVLSAASYRMTQEQAPGRFQSFYWRFHAHRGGAKRSAVTGQCVTGTPAEGIVIPDPVGYFPFTHGTLHLSSLPGPALSVQPCGGGGYYNSLVDHKAWALTRNDVAGGTCVNGTTAAMPTCMMQVGRWHRIETILDLGTPDQPNGSFHGYVDGQLVAFVQNVRMLSNTVPGAQGGAMNTGYSRKEIRDMYHPGGNSTNPRNKPFTDYACIADLYITGELM